MAAQLRKPSGWFGSLVVSRSMNRANRKIVDSTLALLHVSPQDQVLEIGSGGGAAISLLSKQQGMLCNCNGLGAILRWDRNGDSREERALGRHTADSLCQTLGL
jgi:hypothetical protein